MGQEQSKNIQVEIIAMGRNLESFPERFMKEKHPKLKRICLAHNRFRSLPSSFNFAENLEELDLSFNFLNTLPKELSNLSSISKMDLSNNLFREFPHVALKKLTMLLVGSNSLTNFSHDLSILFPNLIFLSVARNRFRFFLFVLYINPFFFVL
jgi:Leucine-rich repeat (LRR) protein